MSSVNILNIIPKNPIAKFTDKFSFEIILEPLSQINKEIDLKMVYITSDNKENDQILGESKILLSNQNREKKFEFTGNAPNIYKIPENDIIGAAAIILSFFYNNQEFFRCGYYLNIYYDNEEMNIKIPDKIEVNHLIRDLLADKPRIVQYEIEWEGENGNNLNKSDEKGNLNVKEGKLDQEKLNNL